MIGKVTTPAMIAEISRLRLDENAALKEIATKLEIGISTVSKYCKGLRNNNPNPGLTKAVREASRKSADARANIIIAANERWPEIKQSPIFLSLVAIYWAEGKKRIQKGHCTEFVVTNSDPGIIKVASIAIEKLGYHNQFIRLKIMPGQDADICKNAWESITGVSVLGITVVKRRSNSTRIWSKFGVANLSVRKSSKAWLAITTWIKCWRDELKTPICGWQS